MSGDPLELVQYDPAPLPWMNVAGAAGRLVARGARSAGSERLEVEALASLAVRDDARARELAGQIRSLALFTSTLLGGPVDLRWLRRLHALEHLTVQSNTGIVHAGTIGQLPALRHATLYAFQRNRIAHLDGIAASRTLVSLDLWWGGIRDLRVLAGSTALRRLSLHENRRLSLAGIQDLELEELDLWLPEARVDLRQLAAARTVRRLSLRGPLSAAEGNAIAASSVRSLTLTGDSARWEPRAIASLPGHALLHLDTDCLAPALARLPCLPATSVSIADVDEAGLAVLARSPRLENMCVQRLAVRSLAPLLDHPTLAGLRFDQADQLRSLDLVPSARFLPRADRAELPNRMVLCGAPLATIRGIGRLHGVDHLDLRGCTSLTTLDGVQHLKGLLSIDLRRVADGLDVSPLADAPDLQAILLSHGRGLPDEAFPPSVRQLLRRDALRGLVNRLVRPRSGGG